MTFRIGLAAILGPSLVLLLAPGVLGHAQLQSSDPPAGGTLSATPYLLTATFSEELASDGSSLVVESEAGQQVALGGVSADDPTTMTAQLPVLPTGTYTVRWTALTSDDNAVERGTYAFTVAPEQASAIASAAPTPLPSGEPAATSGGTTSDLILALVVAAVVIAVVVGFVALRNRR